MLALLDSITNRAANWLSSSGAAQVTLKNSLSGPEGAPAGQTISISGSSQQTTAINASAIDVTCDTVCYVALGANPTASLNTSYRLAANNPIRLPITSGNKLAVIGTSGNIWIDPVI